MTNHKNIVLVSDSIHDEINLALYPTTETNVPRYGTPLAWTELAEALTELDREGIAKGEGQLISPAELLPDATRAKANVARLHFRMFDLDDDRHGAWDVDALKARLADLGVAFVMYPTHSMLAGTKAKAYRLAVPVSRPVLPEEWAAFWAASKDFLGVPDDPATKDASRMYYLPCTPPGVSREQFDALVFSGQGGALDVDALLVGVNVPAKAKRAPKAKGGAAIEVPSLAPNLQAQGIEALREHGKTAEVGVSGREPETRALWFCQFGVKWGLSPEVIAAVACEVDGWANRCLAADGVTSYPFSAEEMLRKAHEAYKGPAETETGLLADVTPFLERRRQISADGDPPKVLQFEVPEGGPVARIKDPSHVYSYVVGTAAPDKPKAIAAGEIVHVLTTHPDWAGVLQWDKRQGRLLAVNPPVRLHLEDGNQVRLGDSDRLAIADWFLAQGSLAYRDDVGPAVRRAASCLEVDPLEEYWDRLPEMDADEADRTLDGMAERLFGKQDDDKREAVEKVFRMWLLSIYRRSRAVAQGRTCQVDTMLVLYGTQGNRKSTFARELTPGSDTYYRSTLTDPKTFGGRNMMSDARGVVVYEIAEVDRITLSRDDNEIKDFLSQPRDDYREFGNGDRVSAPRSCVFVGTTNEQGFLKDPTGARRFWPVETRRKIQKGEVAALRDTIWAAVKARAELGEDVEPHYFEDERDPLLTALRQGFSREEPWAELVTPYLGGRKWVRPIDVYAACIVPSAKPDEVKLTWPKARATMHATLRALGLVNGKLAGGSERVWRVPGELQKDLAWWKEDIAGVMRTMKARQEHEALTDKKLSPYADAMVSELLSN